MSEKSIEYTCKILPFGTFVSIAIAVNIAMSIMFIGIFTHLPGWMNVVIMVGLLFLIFSFITSYATFTLSDTALTRILTSNNFLFKNKPLKQYTWSDVKGFKNGTDRGKYRGEFQYLEIKFKNGEEWKITDMYGERRQDFSAFLMEFLASVNNYNEKNRVADTPAAPTNTGYLNTPTNTFIKREKTIYETILGKLFTIGLGIFIITLLAFGMPYMNGSGLFKLNAVLIPGFIYMVYRTFIKKYK